MAALNFNIDAIEKEITIDEKGVGTMSIRGVARVVSVGHTSLVRAFQGGVENPSKLAAILIRYGFDPVLFGKKGVPDKAVALVVKYYSSEAGARCTDEAKAADWAFAAIGIRTWMQNVKGWTPAQRSAQFLLGDVISREPLPWESHFSKDWARNAERITGYKWECRTMGKFINQHVYDRFPKEIREALDQYNPQQETGHRKRKQHQHFTDDARPMLKAHLGTVLTLMIASVSRQQFEALMEARFNGVYQLRMEEVFSLKAA
jgi:hypothetical protein